MKTQNVAWLLLGLLAQLDHFQAVNPYRILITRKAVQFCLIEGSILQPIHCFLKNLVISGFSLKKYSVGELNPVDKTKKESPRWSTGQTPGLVGCLSCFQLYPFIVVKVNIFVNELFCLLKGGFWELS